MNSTTGTVLSNRRTGLAGRGARGGLGQATERRTVDERQGKGEEPRSKRMATRASESVKAAARGALGRAAAAVHSGSENNFGPRFGAATMAAGFAAAIRAGALTCETCGVSIDSVRTHRGKVIARCRKHPSAVGRRTADLQRVVASWRGRGGEVRAGGR